jgi:hypothetical protein
MPAGDGWSFEFKYDGVRAITHVNQGRVRVLSRNGNDVTTTYPELSALGDRTAILDGEIVALDAGDRPSFAKLAARIHVSRPTTALLKTIPVVYYVFDLLWLNGKSLLDEPYDQRRHLLTDPVTGQRVRPGHPDASAVRPAHGRSGSVSVEQCDKVVEGVELADLLQAECVRRLLVDHRGESGEFVAVGVVGGRAETGSPRSRSSR